ncbi:kinesin-like protein subito isoform X2 [Planococcus citri]|uniref:kinesin-like protein subito isoform X2 n=1 Tax=Planococcus citri TaxID=170843 RepID=UPI0031F8DFA4
MSLIPENDHPSSNHIHNFKSYNPYPRGMAARKLFSQSNDDCDNVFDKDANSFHVYLRIKPNPDYRNTIKIVEGSKLVCKPPITSKVYKSSDKAEYTFSKIFGPETTQQDIFEETVLPCVNDLIRSHNGLVFSYGTTNAGKTYTVQGDVRNPGLIPRTLHAIFSRITPDEEIKFAPHHATSIRKLNINESTNAIIQKEDILRMHASSKNKGGVYPNEICDEYSKLSEGFEDYSYDQETVLPTCSIWVSFIEIYNELIYDLLEPCGSSRTQLKLCVDGHKNYFVKGLRQICVQNAAEAYSIYLYGKKNLSVACTKMNENSSRSHCIFVIKLLNQSDPEFVTMSSLSICDLAGSERQTKTQNTGVRLKESGNINLSLFTLNRCLKTLRENQMGNPIQVMPYRSSKLTQLLCSALLDRNEEKVIMIVNINPAQELYDETQQVLKVCAIACEIRCKPLSTRNIRHKTRFSALVYENESEHGTYRPYDLDGSDCEEEHDPLVEGLQNQVTKLNDELKKKVDMIEYLHKTYKDMLDDSAKFHEDEVEQIRKEMKANNESRIKSIKDYYEWKIEELSKSDGSNVEKLNNSDQMESMELKNKISELEAAMTSLRVEKEQTIKAKDVEAENLKLKQELLESKEKIANLESLLSEAKEEYKNLDKQYENAAIKCSTYREQNKVYQLNVDSLEQSIEALTLELESKDKELTDKSNHIQYLEKLIGDKENLKSKRKTDRKKKLYNPDDENIILTPEDFGSDREVFRESCVKFSARTQKMVSTALTAFGQNSSNTSKTPRSKTDTCPKQGRTRNEVATPAMTVQSHRKKKPY